jgi:hypothetical protein
VTWSQVFFEEGSFFQVAICVVFDLHSRHDQLIRNYSVLSLAKAHHLCEHTQREYSKLCRFFKVNINYSYLGLCSVITMLGLRGSD